MAQASRRLVPDGLERAGPAGGRPGRHLAFPRGGARRSGADRLREPARVPDRGYGGDGAAGDLRPHLHQQPAGGSCPHPARLGGSGRHRVQRRSRSARARGSTPRRRARSHRRHGRRGRDRGRACRYLGRSDGPADEDRRDRRRGRPHPSRTDGLPDLHLRHRRSAEGGDAAAPRHPGQLPRCVGTALSLGPDLQLRGLPLLPAPLPLLRAHLRAVLPALHRHQHLLLHRRRTAGGGDAGRAADRDDGGAPAVRGHPRPHPASGRTSGGGGASGCSTSPSRPG